MISKALVSVCITTHNRKSLLPRCINSVLNQTYDNYEVIIIDDNSTDGTEELVENQYSQVQKISYFKNSSNSGLAFSRNRAISNSKGKYFAFIDDDDEWLPNFISEFVSASRINPECQVFCCGSFNVNILGTTVHTFPKAMIGNLSNFLKEGYTPPVAGQFYLLDSLRKINGYNEEVKSGVDHDLWIRLAMAGSRIQFIDKVLAKVNSGIDPNRITQSSNRMDKLEQSYIIWKPDIIELYGESFYDEFCRSYRNYERKKIVRNNILTGNISKSIDQFFTLDNKPYKFFLRNLMTFFLYKLGISINGERTSIMKPSLNINFPKSEN